MAENDYGPWCRCLLAEPNIPVDRTAHSVGFLVIPGVVSCGPPFTGGNFAQIWEQHLNKIPTPVRHKSADCPVWLDELVLQTLQKDPNRRPFNARAVQGVITEKLHEEFGDDLKQITQDLPPMEQPRAPVNWKRALVAVLAIGALIAGAVLLASFFCSLCEAALYSIPPSRVESLRRAGTRSGHVLAALRSDIDRPIAAILILNTISNSAASPGSS